LYVCIFFLFATILVNKDVYKATQWTEVSTILSAGRLFHTVTMHATSKNAFWHFKRLWFTYSLRKCPRVDKMCIVLNVKRSLIFLIWQYWTCTVSESCLVISIIVQSQSKHMRGPLNEGARQLLRLPLYVCISAYSGDDRLVLFLFRPLFTTCKVDYVSVVFLEISKKLWM